MHTLRNNEAIDFLIPLDTHTRNIIPLRIWNISSQSVEITAWTYTGYQIDHINSRVDMIQLETREGPRYYDSFVQTYYMKKAYHRNLYYWEAADADHSNWKIGDTYTQDFFIISTWFFHYHSSRHGALVTLWPLSPYSIYHMQELLAKDPNLMRCLVIR